MSALIYGFDYHEHRQLSLTRSEWQARIARAMANGGRRRVENGETFIHGPNARIIAEVYANIPASSVNEDLKPDL